MILFIVYKWFYISRNLNPTSPVYYISDGRATDLFRDCVESVGVEDCVSASRYIDEVLRPDFPNIRDFVSSEDGIACYCEGDLCNSELGEPDVSGKSFPLLMV